jgi:hypothetical protein
MRAVESVCALLRAVTALGLGMPVTLVLDNARDQKCGPARRPWGTG